MKLPARNVNLLLKLGFHDISGGVQEEGVVEGIRLMAIFVYVSPHDSVCIEHTTCDQNALWWMVCMIIVGHWKNIWSHRWRLLG